MELQESRGILEILESSSPFVVYQTPLQSTHQERLQQKNRRFPDFPCFSDWSRVHHFDCCWNTKLLDFQWNACSIFCDCDREKNSKGFWPGELPIRKFFILGLLLHPWTTNLDLHVLRWLWADFKRHLTPPEDEECHGYRRSSNERLKYQDANCSMYQKSQINLLNLNTTSDYPVISLWHNQCFEIFLALRNPRVA